MPLRLWKSVNKSAKLGGREQSLGVGNPHTLCLVCILKLMGHRSSDVMSTFSLCTCYPTSS